MFLAPTGTLRYNPTLDTTPGTQAHWGLFSPKLGIASLGVWTKKTKRFCGPKEECSQC